MSLYDDYLKAKKKLSDTRTITPTTTSSLPIAPKSGQANDLLSDYINARSSFDRYSQPMTTVGKLSKEDDDDIAPVKKKKEDEEDDSLLDFFQKGAFEDGFEWSDIPKAILGTVGDAGLGVAKGVLGLGEGLADLATYGAAGVADLVGNDATAERWRTSAKKNAVEDALKDETEFLDQYSVLGRTSDAIMQGVGQVGTIILTGGLGSAAGLGANGVTALTTGMLGLSGAGSGISEAYEDGADDEEAYVYGMISGAADAATELLFGGLGKAVNAVGLSYGLSSADDLLARKVSGMFKDQLTKNIAEYGIKAGAEGLEEVIAGTIQAWGKSITYSEKDLSEIIKDENLLEQFVVGSINSGMIQAGYIPGTKNGSLREANATGRDFITGYSQNEQAVIKKEVDARIAQAEKDGNKPLTKKEKAEIQAKVEQSMERGEIAIDTIEEALGGDTYKAYREAADKENEVLKEFAELYKGDELKQQVSDFLEKSESKTIRERLSKEVSEAVQSDRFLMESYNERARRGQAFQADLSKYDDKQKAVVQKAVESKILNNTRKTHEFVDLVARLSSDQDVQFDFTNNEKLKDSVYAVEGKTVNGYVDESGNIVLNMDSNESRKFVVGHEITHVLEGTDLYNTLQETIFEYAKGKKSSDSKFANEYMERLYYTRQLYKNVEGYQGVEGFQKIKREVVADLVGDYLFTDTDFINNLSTQNRNVFQKIYNEVKYMLKLATAGSKEARDLERIKKAFDEAYRAGGKADVDSSVKYSVYNRPNFTKDEWSIVNRRKFAEFDNPKYALDKDKNWMYFNEKGLTGFAVYTKNDPDDPTVLYGSRGKKALDDYSELMAYQKGVRNGRRSGSNRNRATLSGILDDIDSARRNGSDSFPSLAEIGGQTVENVPLLEGSSGSNRGRNFEDGAENRRNSALTEDYKEEASEEPGASFITFSNDYAAIRNFMKEGDTGKKYSLSFDSKGRELSPAVKKRFGNSKVVDENGNLKVMYHGSPESFTVFDAKKAKSSGLYGRGFYFTNSDSHAKQYGNTYEVYLNITNPLQNGTNDITKDQLRKFIEAIADDEDYGIENYGYEATVDSVTNSVFGKGDFAMLMDINVTCVGNMVEAVNLFNQVNGTDYNGIIAPTETVAFYPEQIKSVDNKNPTDNPDIHRSLSDADNQRRSAADPLSELRLEGTTADDLAPVAEKSSVAPVAPEVAISEEETTTPKTVSEVETVEEPLPDNMKPIQEELSALLDEHEEVEGRLYELSAAEDYGDEYNSLSSKWSELNSRINELEEEIETSEAERLASLNDTDVPPEAVEPDASPDAIPLSKKTVADISREVRLLLALSNKDMADVRKLIEEYSTSETPDRAELVEKIESRFGQYTEMYADEDLREVKQLLRTYPIKVSDSIKGEIADYRQLMRSNFGKIRFSKDGVDVDVAYEELHDRFPGVFPESVNVPTDQLLHIIDVANAEVVTQRQVDIDAESIERVADAIINGISNFRQTHRQKAAGQASRAAFNGLMTNADQHVPPVDQDIAPVSTALGSNQVSGQQTFMQNNATYDADPGEDIAPLFDVTGKKGVPDGQQAFMEDAGVPKKVTRKEIHERMVDNIKTRFREKGFDFDAVLKKAKDLSTFATVDNTPQRVMEKALGYKEGQVLADLTVNKVAQNETDAIKWLNSFTNKKSGVLAQISKQYGIRPGSKKSAAAQMYAEGFYVDDDKNIVKYGDRELAIDFPDPKVRANIKGLARDPRIRAIYDETLARINESRTRNGYPEIPRLDNYFLHFRAMEDTFSRIGLPFNPNDIRAKDLPTDLNGVTADLKPGQPYFASAKHRMGQRTSFDLLGGMERYLSSAKNQIYHIDDIQTLRALRDYIANTYGQAHGLEDLDTLSNQEAEERIEEVFDAHLSTFAKFLNEEANVLAGKTSLVDRGIEGIIGRRGITFLDTLNRQVGANMVGFNISSSLTNFLSVAQALAKTKKSDFVKGFTQTAANRITSFFGKNDGFADSSPVMIRRKGAESFYRTLYQKSSDMGYILMSFVDDLSTEMIARTKYNEFVRKGMDSQQAHFETDKWVSRLMGDRSLGQQPQLYNSKMLGIITKFQLEVRNQLDSQFYDTIQEAKVSTEDIQNGLLRNAKKAAKVTSTFVQLALLQNLFGKVFEEIAGYNPAFDIISVLIKTFGLDDEEDDEDTVLDNLEEGFMELLGDLPYTSTLTGGRIPISSALPITELVKGEDQYGNEKSRWKTLGEVAPYYYWPGGYGQAKKTWAGKEMFSDEHPVAGSYTDSGNLRFPIDDTLLNRAQAAVFGQYANQNARDYFSEERKALKEDQIDEFIAVDMPIQEYWKYRDGLKDLEKQDEKVAYINSLNLTKKQKDVLKSYLFDEAGYAEDNPEKYAFLKKEGIGYLGYKQLDSDTQDAWSWAFKHQDEYNYLKENGVLPGDYSVYRIPMLDFADEGNEAYTWAYDNPEKATIGKAFSGGVKEYKKYSDSLYGIKADKDKNGKTINGSRKAKVAEYIASLDIDDMQKAMLFRSEYSSFDDYNYEIVEYLNGRNDLTYSDVVTILKYLDFEVDSEGNVSW